ncbi:hypothetical protein L1987_44311 [Smallanthus sonchifolius]|uniref:Uncharacterized protein n=1 Tax=Smallanthus sonchifolius TaxID=185202 RepID=A0ACB9GP47_9ASTR|nr:hypothetical protein L1987_44311 [Smallanthus sonchifolius]
MLHPISRIGLHLLRLSSLSLYLLFIRSVSTYASPHVSNSGDVLRLPIFFRFYDHVGFALHFVDSGLVLDSAITSTFRNNYVLEIKLGFGSTKNGRNIV